jgi:hypothetical protein
MPFINFSHPMFTIYIFIHLFVYLFIYLLFSFNLFCILLFIKGELDCDGFIE